MFFHKFKACHYIQTEKNRYFTTLMFHILNCRRCLTSFWMRISWKMHVSTWLSIWRRTGKPHTPLAALHSTHCWDGTSAPLPSLHTPPLSLACRSEAPHTHTYTLQSILFFLCSEFHILVFNIHCSGITL